MDIKRTAEFDLAFKFVTETNQNIFLTGKAGTGKTTFLKYLRENSTKNIVVAAPTGVAAINARGITLHSLFQLPFGIIIPAVDSLDKYKFSFHPQLSKIHYYKEKLELLQNLELLIIDEASMVAAYHVDAIDTILKYVRRNADEPFGGVQILFIGDLYQLPPVIKNEDWVILQNYYSSPFFFDSIILRNNIPAIIELKEIFRQKDDEFIEILNGIRNNNITQENFNLLNSHLNRDFFPDESEGYITLSTHNYQADEINKRKLKSLSTQDCIFSAAISGDFPENNFPAEKELILKSGAQVMFLKNDMEGKQYFNGKIGIVTELGNDSIRVKCKDESTEIEVKKYEWQNISYKINPETREIKEEVLGSFNQFPLRLAWAITIHKSQGLTFNKVIIDAEKAFAMGQVYVALSRCTSMEGLVLRTPVYRNFLGAHRALKEWLSQNCENDINQQLNEAREKYLLKELLNIFTWKNWYYGLKDLSKFILENQKEPDDDGRQDNERKHNRKIIPEDLIPWVTELVKKQNELYEISEKFKQIIIKLYNEKPVILQNEALQKRIKDGTNYFHSEISKWQEQIYNHPINVETKKLARRIDELLEWINFVVSESLQKISFCRNGFIPEAYLTKGRVFNQMELKKLRSSYIYKAKENTIGEVPHPELQKLFLKLRDEIRKETGLPDFLIFTNNSIKKFCMTLPTNKIQLRKVRGLGQAQISIHGDKIISLIKKYIEDNDITSHFNDDLKIIQIKKPDTVAESIRLLREGKTIEQIAAERNFVVSTIESHLAQAVEKNLVDIEEIMSIEEVRKIAEYFPKDLENVQLTPIKENGPEEVSFGKLRWVLAWLKKKSPASLRKGD